ncbi:MAG TPA: 6-phosphogluconate dehydrogenase (decarboxylating) [Cellvibrio sp.]|nr:6-phosphogluconate dehydrogenase (decarboxylating) [Cellvibrio sp.]
MRLGMIGFGNMGTHLTRKLLRGNHECVVLNSSPIAVEELAEENALITFSLEKFVEQLPSPRIIWMTAPEALMDQLLLDLTPHLTAGDILIDGGNSYYMDDIVRAKKLGEKGIHYIDCCACGGQFGLLHGYRLLIGGDHNIVEKLIDIFTTLTQGKSTTAHESVENIRSTNFAQPGYLHCGPNGAGHFVKMIRNAIEYGLMGAYAEGMKDLKRVKGRSREETSDVWQGATYHSLGLRTIAKIWNRGSRHLDLMVTAVLKESEGKIFSQPLRDNTVTSSSSQATKNNPAYRGLKRNWRVQSHDSNYDRYSASQEVAAFTDKMLSAICREYNDYDESQSDSDVLQRLMKHGYQKVCPDYQSVLNQ